MISPDASADASYPRLLLAWSPQRVAVLVAWKRILQGSVLGFVGFMLSPLSWWNDAFVNLPLAVGFGWLVALVYRPAFEGGVIAGYWLTNVLGLVLMHKGCKQVRSPDQVPTYGWRSFCRDLLISLLYTIGIFLLLNLKVLKPFADYYK